jgi:hypothetical protein
VAEERDLEGTVGDGAGLADELVQPLSGHRSVALVVNIGPVGRARRLPVEEHAEPHGRARYCRPHDHVEVAGVEAGIRASTMDLILSVTILALLAPVLIFIATATRLSAARREQRFAAMRLTGATPRQITLIAAV